MSTSAPPFSLLGIMKTTMPTNFIFKALGTVSFVLLFISLSVDAQNAKKGAVVKGTIIDNQTNVALGYATIRVLKSTDSTLAGGSISDDKGAKPLLFRFLKNSLRMI